MLCYKDMSFCTAKDCDNTDCSRNLNSSNADQSNVPEHLQLPYAVIDFKGSDFCIGYIAPKKENQC